MADSTEIPAQIWPVVSYVLTAVGPVGAFLLARDWLNRRGAKQRKPESEQEEPAPFHATIRQLVEQQHATREHVKQNTDRMRDLALLVEKMTAQGELISAVNREEQHEIRESQRRTESMLERMAERIADIQHRRGA